MRRWLEPFFRRGHRDQEYIRARDGLSRVLDETAREAHGRQVGRIQAIVRHAIALLASERRSFRRRTGHDHMPHPGQEDPIGYLESLVRKAESLHDAELREARSLADRFRNSPTVHDLGLVKRRRWIEAAVRWWLEGPTVSRALRGYLWLNLFAPDREGRPPVRTDLRILAYAAGLDGAEGLRKELSQLLRMACRRPPQARVHWTGPEDDPLELLGMRTLFTALDEGANARLRRQAGKVRNAPETCQRWANRLPEARRSTARVEGEDLELELHGLVLDRTERSAGIQAQFQAEPLAEGALVTIDGENFRGNDQWYVTRVTDGGEGPVIGLVRAPRS